MSAIGNRKYAGLAVGVCFGAMALLEALAKLGFELPAAGMLFLLIIAYASLRGGVRTGMLASAVAIVYVALRPARVSLPAEGPAAFVSVAWFAAMAILDALLVGLLKQKEALAIRRESEQMEHAHAIAMSERRFRSMADQAPGFLWLADEVGDRVFFNRAWLAFTGRPLSEETGKGWMSSIHPDDLTACREAYCDAVRTGREFALRYRFKNAQGEHRLIVDHGTPARDADGVSAGFVGTCFDITEAELVKQELRRSEARFERLVRSNLVGVAMVEDNGQDPGSERCLPQPDRIHPRRPGKRRIGSGPNHSGRLGGAKPPRLRSLPEP